MTERFLLYFMVYVTFQSANRQENKRKVNKMKKNGKKLLILGTALLGMFAIWTWLIQCVDVQSAGQKGTEIGFATFNCWFHRITGVHMAIYTITDWLGLVPIFVCIVFGGVGFVQLVNRKSLFKVDRDLIFLGIYYVAVIFGYLIFEMLPINYRPILIDGMLEASYPSSTTLLVLSVMSTLVYQVNRRSTNPLFRRCVRVMSIIFSSFMVIGRLVAGVHWFTDIVGAVILSTGLYCLYKSIVLLFCDDK